MEGYQRTLFHLFLVLFLFVAVPIAVLFALFAIAKEVIADSHPPAIFSNALGYLRRYQLPVKHAPALVAVLLPLAGGSIHPSTGDDLGAGKLRN